MFVKFFYNAPTDQSGTTENPAQMVEQIKKTAQKSISSIVDESFVPEMLSKGNVEVPLGDTSPLSQNGNSDQVKPPAEPMISKGNPPNANDIFKQLDELDSEIDSAQLPNDKSPESMRSFEGLKTRYKNKNGGIRKQVEGLVTQVTALTSQLNDLPKVKEKAEKYDEVVPTVQALEEENATLKKENENLSYYRRKYDLENDPVVKREFIDPMNQLKERSMDILTHNNLDEDFWNQLVGSTSEYEINTLIDSKKLGPMNSQSLKNYAVNYRLLKDEYGNVSSPENIDAAIDTAKGRRLQHAKTLADATYNAMQAQFGTWVDELKESEFNKEHNIFVFEEVKKQARINFDNLLSAFPKDFTDKRALYNMSKAALMAAAYPMQKQMLDHALGIIQNLKEEILNSGTPGMRQTKESAHKVQMPVVEEIKQASQKTIADITKEVFSGQLR